MRAPDLIEPVVGYRSWVLDLLGKEPGLRALTGRGAWKLDGWNTAKCEPSPLTKNFKPYPSWDPTEHEAPGKNCHCGFNMYHDHVGGYSFRSSGPLTVYGVCQAKGRLEVHNKGFRAEKAKIVAIIPPSLDQIIEYLAINLFTARKFEDSLDKRAIRVLNDFIDEVKLHRIYIVDCPDDLTDIGHEYGTEIPEELKPQDDPPWDQMWVTWKQTTTARDEFHAKRMEALKELKERERSRREQLKREARHKRRWRHFRKKWL